MPLYADGHEDKETVIFPSSVLVARGMLGAEDGLSRKVDVLRTLLRVNHFDEVAAPIGAITASDEEVVLVAHRFKGISRAIGILR